MRDRVGFSLIELVISIAIIGLLSSIIFPNFSKIQMKAKDTTARSVTYSVQMAIEAYYLSNGQYPQGQGLEIMELYELLKTSGELTRLPTNPYTGKIYTSGDDSGKIQYTYNEDSESYTLVAFGNKNKEELVRLENI